MGGGYRIFQCYETGSGASHANSLISCYKTRVVQIFCVTRKVIRAQEHWLIPEERCPERSRLYRQGHLMQML